MGVLAGHAAHARHRGRGDEVLVRDEARSGVRLEHVIGEGVLAREVEVRLVLGRRHLRVGRQRRVGGVEAVHAAVVVLRLPVLVRVRDVIGLDHARVDQGNHGAVVLDPHRFRVRTLEAVEQVIDGAVLLDDDDHVLHVLAESARHGHVTAAHVVARAAASTTAAGAAAATAAAGAAGAHVAAGLLTVMTASGDREERRHGDDSCAHGGATM
jgi:hypothetical protein